MKRWALILSVFVLIGVLSCEKDEIVEYKSPEEEIKEQEPVKDPERAYFSHFWVTGGENAGVYADFECPINQFIVDITCPYLTDPSAVVVSFDGNFSSVTVDGVPQVSGVTAQDFNHVVQYDLLDELGRRTSYLVRLKAANGLPRLFIKTKNGRSVTSKTEYVQAEFRIDNDPDNGILESPGQIRGRGNATWTYNKKPYKIEFEEKQSVFGFPANKDWVLLAEYCDKSLMRTAYMCGLSERAGLPYTIHYRHIELYMNGSYQGVYVLTDQVEKAKHRVNLADDGYLIENDNYWYQEKYNFGTAKGWRFTFKYPKEPTGEQISFIKSWLNQFESVLYGADFKDPEKGYRKLIDERTFAKWYLVNELTGNLEPNIFYVLYDRNAELQMFPDWDAEWSLGLAARGNDWAGWAMPPATSPVDIRIWSKDRYFTRLFEDPYFVDIVREEWALLKPQLADFAAEMERMAFSLIYGQAANFDRWPVLNTYLAAGLVALGSWVDEVEYVRDFFAARTAWFDGFIAAR